MAAAKPAAVSPCRRGGRLPSNESLLPIMLIPPVGPAAARRFAQHDSATFVAHLQQISTAMTFSTLSAANSLRASQFALFCALRTLTHREGFKMSRTPLLVFATLCAIAAAATQAQGKKPVPAAAQPGQLEEVVVTAERREASLESVPIAVTAITAEALTNHQVTEARDLERYAPSLRMSNNITSPTNLSPSLRGSLQQDASLVVAESPFGIYVDDVYIGRLNGNNVTLADVERVEVLRGPQGTLYGRNTLAGAIKFVSRTPGKDSWLTAKMGYGNYDQYVASFSAGGPLTDSWAASFAAQVNHKDGEYYNNVTGQKRGLERNVATRAKLHYLGSERLDAVLSASYADSKNDAVQLLPGTSPSVPATNQYNSDNVVLQFGNDTLATPNVTGNPPLISNQPLGKTKQTIISANVAYRFDSFTLRSISGYVKTKDYFSTDFSGVGQVLGASNPTATQLTEELQIQGTAANDSVNYLAGVYWLKEDGKQDFAWNITRPFFNVGPVSTSQIDASTTSVSVFGQADYKFTDALKLTVGGRWVQDKKDFNFGFQSKFLPVPPTFLALKNTYREFTPKIGLDYKLDIAAPDSALLYISAARGFKSGGYNGINITDPSIASSTYRPEKNTTIEAGIKADMYEKTIRVNAALFQANITDLTLNATVLLANGTASFPVQNAGKAKVNGLELETTYLPTDNLNTYFNISFLHGAYSDLNPTSAPGQFSTAQARLGTGITATPPQLPKFTYTLGFDYGHTVQLGSQSARWKFGADWYRTDDYVTAATNDFIITAYSRFNGYVGLGLGDNWDLRLAARNLNNDKKVYVGSRGFLGGYLVLPPRELMFSVSFKL